MRKEIEVLEYQAELAPYLGQFMLVGIMRLTVRISIDQCISSYGYKSGVNCLECCCTAKQCGLSAT